MTSKEDTHFIGFFRAAQRRDAFTSHARKLGSYPRDFPKQIGILPPGLTHETARAGVGVTCYGRFRGIARRSRRMTCRPLLKQSWPQALSSSSLLVSKKSRHLSLLRRSQCTPSTNTNIVRLYAGVRKAAAQYSGLRFLLPYNRERIFSFVKKYARLGKYKLLELNKCNLSKFSFLSLLGPSCLPHVANKKRHRHRRSLSIRLSPNTNTRFSQLFVEVFDAAVQHPGPRFFNLFKAGLAFPYDKLYSFVGKNNLLELCRCNLLNFLGFAQPQQLRLWAAHNLSPTRSQFRRSITNTAQQVVRRATHISPKISMVVRAAQAAAKVDIKVPQTKVGNWYVYRVGDADPAPKVLLEDPGMNASRSHGTMMGATIHAVVKNYFHSLAKHSFSTLPSGGWRC